MGAKLLRELSSEHTHLRLVHHQSKSTCQVFFSRDPSGLRNIHVFVEDLGHAIKGVLTTNVKHTKLGDITENVKLQKISDGKKLQKWNK